MEKREGAWLFLLICLATLIRAAFLTRVEVVLPDEAYYIRWAQDEAAGKFFNAFDANHKGQPLLPAIFAAALKWGADPATTCAWVSVLIGALTLIPFHFCVRSFASARQALWSDCVYALSPFAIRYSLWAMPHALFNLGLVLVLCCALRGQITARLRWSFLAAAAAWVTYLARAEGFLFAAYFLLAVFCFPGPRFRRALVFTATFTALSLPVWIWIRMETGAWQLTWTDGRGAGGAALELVLGASSHPAFFYAKQWAKVYDSTLPRVVPLLIWATIAFGIAETLKRNPQNIRAVLIVALFAIFPLFFYPLFSLEERMLHPSAVFLLLFSGPAIDGLYQWLSRKTAPLMAALLCAVFLLLNFLPGYGLLLTSFREEPLEQKRLGEWIKANAGTPKVILGSDRRCAFYAGTACKRFVSMASSSGAGKDPATFEAFLRREGIDYVVADSRYIPRYYPEFEFLLAPPPMNHFKEVTVLREGSQSIRLYESVR